MNIRPAAARPADAHGDPFGIQPADDVALETQPSLLFAHWAADAASARPLGYMLQAFGLGLIPFSAQYLLLRGFYAFEDTRTPFFMEAWIGSAWRLGSRA